MSEERAKLNVMRQDAVTIFNSALSAVNAFSAVKTYCRLRENILYINEIPYHLNDYKKIKVIGAGKASAHMAAAIEDILGEKITHGIIIVKYGHTVPLKKISLIEAGHPSPDENGRDGALKILQLAKDAQKDDLIICLISGGGSALLPLPDPPITLADKQKTLQTLFSCGAEISEINTLRKHMSAIKAGRLAEKIHPATLITLIISDVVGDPLDVIASGPTVGDPGTFSDCMRIIDKYDIQTHIPASVYKHFKNGMAAAIPDTPKPGDPVFKRTMNMVIANNRAALAAAKTTATALGYKTLILSSELQGDTRESAHMHAAIAKEIYKTGNPVQKPACILSGGETTVMLRGNGRGGRNQEFALTAALDITDTSGMVILSAGTDGTDGPTDAAGAMVDSTTISKALADGLNPSVFLENNDSYHFFKKTGDLLMTGPTGTNVMDLRIMLIK